ncbi:MAG: hypothetical protein ACRDKS_05970 [Actinomycetota bacterium]
MFSSAKRLIIGLATLAWLAVVPSAAFAQGYPGGSASPSPTVKGTKFFPGDDLSGTGTDVLMIVLIALTVLVIGLALHRLSRAAPRDN